VVLLLTTKQAAEMLSVSVATIQRWKRDGLLPYVRVRRGSSRNIAIRFRTEDLEAFVRDHVLIDRSSGPVQYEPREVS